MQWVCTAPELKRFISGAHFLNMSLLLPWIPPPMKVQWFGNFQSINDLRNLHRQLIHCCGVSKQNYEIKVLIFITICITNTFRIYNLYDYRKLCSKEQRLALQSCEPLTTSKHTNEIYCNRQNYEIKVLIFITICITNTFRIYNLYDYRKLRSKERRLALQSCAPLTTSKHTNEIYCNRKHIIYKCVLCFMYWISCGFRLLLTHIHSLIANHDKDITLQR